MNGYSQPHPSRGTGSAVQQANARADSRMSITCARDLAISIATLNGGTPINRFEACRMLSMNLQIGR